MPRTMSPRAVPRGAGGRPTTSAVPFLPGLIVLVAVAFALLWWGHRYGAVLGSPWVLAGLVGLFGAAGHERWQRLLGGGELHNRPVLRLVLALGLAATMVTYAGWSFMLPASAVMIGVVHIGWSGGSIWRSAAVLTAATTAAAQGALQAGLVSSVMPTGHSHFAAVWSLALAVFGLSNLGLSAIRGEGAADALSHAEGRFRALVQKSSDVVTVLDPDARLTHVSPAMLHITGWDPDELLGTDRFRLLHADDVPRARATLAEVVAAGDGHERRLEVRSRQRDGSWRWHEITMRNLLGDPAVHGIVSNERDVSDRREHQDQLVHAATHDGLTELPNRGEVLRRLTGALRTARPDRAVAVLFIDLDGFKNVNDTYGHATGDALLLAAAERLQQSLRDTDVLGRLGGDEFAAILSDVSDPASAQERADELMAAMREPFHLGDYTVRIGASIGAALAEDPGTDPAVLIERADAEMYRVKRSLPGAAGSGTAAVATRR
ncbi:sensor domain-containing diguanylate cyclase [Actinoplanes sp. NPDC049118]|uniref:sensor domain-containing diguanylate cyclase n=1 Tax=Actinoplanes sp. NPDC049118 TaxID=3155769 RepID=UPI00340A5BA7